MLADLPWRTFTVSRSLQPGIWLLRRLRRLSRPLAFSRPRRVKRCESSPVPSVAMIVSFSSLLYAGWSVETALNTSEVVEATTLPFGLGVVSAISPIAAHDAYNGFPSTQISCVYLGHRVIDRSTFGWPIGPFVSRLSHPGMCRTPTQAAQPSGHCSNQALFSNRFRC